VTILFYELDNITRDIPPPKFAKCFGISQRSVPYPVVEALVVGQQAERRI